MQVITSNGAFSLITKPTRVTDKTATVIDHIIIMIQRTQFYPVLYLLLQRIITQSCVKLAKLKSFAKNYLFLSTEIKKNFCPEAFSDNLNRKLGNLISNDFSLNRDNFNKTFYQFINLIAKIIDKHAPLQRLSRKQKKLASKPWITKGILISIRKKCHV